MKRPSKFLRLNYASQDPQAFLAIMGDPNEVRISAGEDSFISVRDGVVTISPGVTGKLNIQALPGALKYGGMISELPFPLAMLPKTPFTPLPTHIISPPLKELLPTIREIGVMASTFVVPV